MESEVKVSKDTEYRCKLAIGKGSLLSLVNDGFKSAACVASKPLLIALESANACKVVCDTRAVSRYGATHPAKT